MAIIWHRDDAPESTFGVRLKTLAERNADICNVDHPTMTFDSVGHYQVADDTDHASRRHMLGRFLHEPCESSSSSSSSSCGDICDVEVAGPIDDHELDQVDLWFDTEGHLYRIDVCDAPVWQKEAAPTGTYGVRLAVYLVDMESSSDDNESSSCDYESFGCGDTLTTREAWLIFDSEGHLQRIEANAWEATGCGPSTPCCAGVDRLPRHVLMSMSWLPGPRTNCAVLHWNGCKYTGQVRARCNLAGMGEQTYTTPIELACVAAGSGQSKWLLCVDGVSNEAQIGSDCCPLSIQFVGAGGFTLCGDGASPGPDCNAPGFNASVSITELPCVVECDDPIPCLD